VGSFGEVREGCTSTHRFDKVIDVPALAVKRHVVVFLVGFGEVPNRSST
jgi:hypothetical protein